MRDPERASGICLATSGVLNLICMGMGAMLSTGMWPGMLLLGSPLLLLGFCAEAMEGETGKLVGLYAWATIGQGLVCAVIGPPALAIVNVGFMTLGLYMHLNPLEEAPEPDERSTRIYEGRVKLLDSGNHRK